VGGQFVTFATGNQDPVTFSAYGTAQVGGTLSPNVWSPTFALNRRVNLAAAGDTKWQVAGLTLYTTARDDENGNRLVNLPYSHTEARNFVQTGFAVPLLKRGRVTIAQQQFEGTTPIAGWPIVISGSKGGFACVSPSYATGSSVFPTVVGRCISNSGTYNGVGVLQGLAQIEIAL